MEKLEIESFHGQKDGKLLFQTDYTDKGNLITWLMSYQYKVELLEPEEIRAEIRTIIKNMKKIFVRKTV